MGALFFILLVFHPMVCKWLYDNWTNALAQKSLSWMFMVA